MNLDRIRDATRFDVVESACIRCAGCSTIAPGLFRIGPAAAAVARQPSTETERAAARAATLCCPTSAIVACEGEAMDAPEAAANGAGARGFLDGAIYLHAFVEAEGVRWRMADLPLDALDRAAVTPDLRRLVREIALSELTTFSASRRFLSEFADDADLSQWIAVWLYEETRHPQAMMRWLMAVGEDVAPTEIVRARATAPFIRSRTGTLVMNVISEAIAAARYLGFSRHGHEPSLQKISRLLAADEARHGATFFAYARRRIDASTDPDTDRLDALKVLYFWLFEADNLQHPVNMFQTKAIADEELARAIERMRIDRDKVQRRVCAIVGELVGLPLDGPEAVMPALRALAAEARAGRAGARRASEG